VASKQNCIDQLLQIIDQAYDRKSWHGTNLRGSLRGLSRRRRRGVRLPTATTFGRLRFTRRTGNTPCAGACNRRREGRSH
jgi:hypothetical protein